MHKINAADIYIFGWLMMYIIMSVFPSKLSGVLLLVLGILSLGIFAYVLFTEKHPPIPLKYWSLFTIILMIYGVIHLIQGEVLTIYETGIEIPPQNYLKMLIFSCVPIYAFYYFTKRKLLTLPKIQCWSIIFCIVAIIQYIITQNRFDDIFDSDFTNNAGYIVLSIFPLLAVWHNRKLIQFAITILIVFFTLISAKRGAILIAFLCFAFLVFSSFKNKQKRGNKLIVLVTILVSMVILYQLILMQFSHNEYLMNRLYSTRDGNYSGRDVLYAYFIDYYFNVYDILHKLFGGGADHTIEIYDNYAHNDWIEILINNGLLGFFVYLFFWLAIIRTWLSQRQIPLYYETLGLYIMVYFCRTFFSMSYFDISIYSSIMLGYILCQLSDSTKTDVPITGKHYQ